MTTIFSDYDVIKKPDSLIIAGPLLHTQPVMVSKKSELKSKDATLTSVSFSFFLFLNILPPKIIEISWK